MSVETPTTPDSSTFDPAFSAEHPFVSQDTHAQPNTPIMAEVPTTEDHFAAVEDMQKLAAASKRLQTTNEGAKLIASVEPVRKLGAAAEVVATGAMLVGLGAGLAEATDAHVQNLEKEGQQHQQEVDENLHQQQFDQGLNNGKVTIDVSATEQNK